MAQTIAPRISAFAIYQRSKEEREREEKRQADKTKVLCCCRINSTRPRLLEHALVYQLVGFSYFTPYR